MYTKFFHKKDGGEIRMAAAPTQTQSGAFPGSHPDVAYQCVVCMEFVKAADVTDVKPVIKPPTPATPPPAVTQTKPPAPTGNAPAPTNPAVPQQEVK
jgi:hypothetical protein